VDVVDAAKALDRHYTPTRYPNTHPHGAPAARSVRRLGRLLSLA